MMGDELKPMQMRLAFRKEGKFVNAYLAQSDTMNGSLHLASMRVSVCDAQPEIWEEFKALMRRVLDTAIRESLDVAPEWTGERPAPEHERAGEA